MWKIYVVQATIFNAVNRKNRYLQILLLHREVQVDQVCGTNKSINLIKIVICDGVIMASIKSDCDGFYNQLVHLELLTKRELYVVL